MKTILLTHAEKYPKLEPTDAVKLLYQSEFGGGHLIRDEESCLRFLRAEYAATPQQPDLPLMEDIGGGICRVNLAALDAHGISPEELGQAFLKSAAIPRGSPDDFRQKLKMLTQLAEKGQMPFSPDALEEYLDRYEAAGFPPVSHSETYRLAYRPAYRVVDRKELKKML